MQRAGTVYIYFFNILFVVSAALTGLPESVSYGDAPTSVQTLSIYPIHILIPYIQVPRPFLILIDAVVLAREWCYYRYMIG